MNERYILAVDQSTQGTKALVLDPRGRVLSRSQKAHRQIVNEKGWVEHDPEEILDNTLWVCRAAICGSGVDPACVAAMGITNQRETVVAWDRITGKPLYNAIVWQCARAKELCAALAEKEASVREKTGLPLSPYFSGAKLAWMLRHVPAVARAKEEGRLCCGTMDSFLLFRLTRERSYCTDYSNASRTQLFNIRQLRWDEEICRMFGLDVQILPRVCMSDDLYGHTDLGGFLEQPLPICGVLGDSHGALLGQQCRRPGEVKATYGTGSSVMMQLGPRPCESGSGLVTSIAWGLGGTVEYVLEGNLNYTGAVVSWMRDQAGLIEKDEDTERFAFEANEEDGCCFVPAFTGLGAPYWDSDATGMFTGITRTTGRKELVKAGLESIAYQITDLLRLMGECTGLEAEQLRVDGGPTENRYLMQFQSDLSGARLRVPEVRELSCLGVAAAAWSCLTGDADSFFAERRFLYYEPRMDALWREKRYARWKKAVRQVLTK